MKSGVFRELGVGSLSVFFSIIRLFVLGLNELKSQLRHIQKDFYTCPTTAVLYLFREQIWHGTFKAIGERKNKDNGTEIPWQDHFHAWYGNYMRRLLYENYFLILVEFFHIIFWGSDEHRILFTVRGSGERWDDTVYLK